MFYFDFDVAFQMLACQVQTNLRCLNFFVFEFGMLIIRQIMLVSIFELRFYVIYRMGFLIFVLVNAMTNLQDQKM